MVGRREKDSRPNQRRKISADRPPFFREQLAARRYTAKWHRVLAWVLDALWVSGMEEVELSPPKAVDRVEQHAVSLVRDLTDAEEAYVRGIGLELLSRLPAGPSRRIGGYRRVVVAALTWSPDHEGEVAYDPAWITLGRGFTAKQAAANAARFVRDYTRALDKRVVSRELIFTALEIKFWTARESAVYV